MTEYGTHIQVAKWLEVGIYRSLVHRHDDSYVAVDESERLIMRASTIPLLADSLMNWPQDALPMPKTEWVKISA